MIKYRMLDNKRFCKTFYKIDGTKFWYARTYCHRFYKIDGTKFWYWSFNKHKWVSSTNPWTTADTKITKPISKSELFLKLL